MTTDLRFIDSYLVWLRITFGLTQSGPAGFVLIQRLA
jgi:hypothetical protein